MRRVSTSKKAATNEPRKQVAVYFTEEQIARIERQDMGGQLKLAQIVRILTMEAVGVREQKSELAAV